MEWVIDCPFKNTDVMGVIFENLSQRENIILQRLNRQMYYRKVPTFVRTVYLNLFSFPKLLPKHEFIHMVWTL